MYRTQTNFIIRKKFIYGQKEQEEKGRKKGKILLVYKNWRANDIHHFTFAESGMRESKVRTSVRRSIKDFFFNFMVESRYFVEQEDQALLDD